MLGQTSNRISQKRSELEAAKRKFWQNSVQGIGFSLDMRSGLEEITKQRMTLANIWIFLALAFFEFPHKSHFFCIQEV